jgi:ADP-ribose pyrophosphatase
VSGGERLGGRRVYAGRIFSLDIDSVRYPDGSTGEMEIIRHPGASAVVPVLGAVDAADPPILLLRQYRHAAGQFLYEIPAGRLEPGEDPAVCAGRELQEETGYTAGRVAPLFTMYTTPGFTDELIHLFVASALVRGEAARERDEFIELEEHSLSAALAMIDRGEIIDSKTALALLFFSRHGRGA